MRTFWCAYFGKASRGEHGKPGALPAGRNVELSHAARQCALGQPAHAPFFRNALALSEAAAKLLEKSVNRDDHAPSLWREAGEIGSVWGMGITVQLYRLGGRWISEPILWGIAGYFFLKDGRTRAISRQYLAKVLKGKNKTYVPTSVDVYRHYLSFARTSLDRFDVWSDRMETYTFHHYGEEHLSRLVDAGRGAVLIGAHLGNFDTLRALGKRRGAKRPYPHRSPQLAKIL